MYNFSTEQLIFCLPVISLALAAAVPPPTIDNWRNKLCVEGTQLPLLTALLVIVMYF